MVAICQVGNRPLTKGIYPDILNDACNDHPEKEGFKKRRWGRKAVLLMTLKSKRMQVNLKCSHSVAVF